MEIFAKVEGDRVLIIEMADENLDASNVRDFRERMHALIQKRTRVLFDMSKVKFVDSSGLGAIISCQRILKSQSGEFGLCGMTVPVKALFDLMRMQRIFRIHDTREAALKAFQESGEMV